ncbi:CHAT domain-containing protein, partial [Streptomyces hayashii]|uniref:CHAT domain-containing protein n=1 Tax=Streptomyces hayashii TaxID=2839966 RepID=UPI00403C46EF
PPPPALALASPVGSDAGRAEQALRLLEAGRAVLLGQALETRGDLTALREHRPDLARRFVELRERLDEPTSMTAGESGAEAAEAAGHALRQEPPAYDRRLTVEEFAAVLDEIRALDGFASFALPPSVKDLLAHADQGPVVVFNISDHRSDALLLTSKGITALELPGLVPARVTEQTDLFRRARRVAVSGPDQHSREEAQATLVEVLGWLWDEAVGPVMEALERDGHLAVEHAESDDSGESGQAGESGEEKLPRVWWAPGGLLGQLPVHAAGHHTATAGEARPRTVMDRAVSSYTPTVRALGYARERSSSPAARPPAAPRSLIVAMPTTPGLPGGGRLGFVDAEVAMLRSRLPDPVLLREPEPTGAAAAPAAAAPAATGTAATGTAAALPTKANVLAHLPECTIAHFACHGAGDLADPSKSLLLLHDHTDDPLTVAGLAPVALDRTRLAYLSACGTAVVDTPALRDEAIHLTSAFQLAGIPHVIGTLWEIDDQTAVTVADLFYAGLRVGAAGEDCAESARALHAAVRRLRDGHGLPAPFDRTRAPLLWAAHVHAGA